MTHKRNSLLQELALLWRQLKSTVSNSLKHLSQVYQVVFKCAGIDDNIIQPNHANLVVQVTHHLHHLLVSSRCIRQSEWHTIPFKQAKGSCGESSKLLMVLLDVDLMITRLHVDHTEIASSRQAVKNILQSWKGIGIFHCTVVQGDCLRPFIYLCCMFQESVIIIIWCSMSKVNGYSVG